MEAVGRVEVEGIGEGGSRRLAEGERREEDAGEA